MASPATFKPISPSLGSQHAFPGSLSSSTHLALVTSDKFSSKWRVCSALGNRLVFSGAKGVANQDVVMRSLVYVDDTIPGTSAEPSYDLPPSDGLPETADVPDVSSTNSSAGLEIPESSGAPVEIPEVSSDSPSTGVDIPDVTSGSSISPEPGALTTDTVEPPKDLLPEFSPAEVTPDESPFSAAASDATSALKDAADSVTNTLAGIQESGVTFFNGIKQKVTSSIAEAENSVKQAYDDINGSLLRVVRGTGGNGSQETESSFGIDLTSPFRTGTPANNALKELVTFVKSGAGAVGHSVSEGYFYLKSIAPVEVQTSLDVTEKKVEEALTPLGSFFGQAVESVTGLEKALGVDPENPIIPILLVGGGTLYLGVLYWQSKYGGYAGDISAEQVFELLNKESDIVLVDIRPQELKDRDGIPDVRRRGRFKVASVDPLEVERPARNLVKDPDYVSDLLTAALIRNLKIVKPSTKVVIMDANGSQSKNIAKALRKTGVYRTYRLDGGFAAWSESGLRQKSDGQETPLSILKEETEAVISELKPTLVLAVALGTLVAGYALYEWEKTLQFLGVLAVFQVVYQRLESYESAEDFNADIRILQAPFRFLASLLGGQPKPRLELATSPSTTAVQDRVVQAAAKHGPSPAEQRDETVQSELPEEVEEEEAVNQEPPAPPTLQADAPTLQVDEG